MNNDIAFAYFKECHFKYIIMSKRPSDLRILWNLLTKQEKENWYLKAIDNKKKI